MKRFLSGLIVIAIILLYAAFLAYAANVELGDLTALTTPAGEDLLLIIDDPSSAATAKKITYSYLVLNPTDAVTITKDGTATSAVTFLTLANTISAASMTATETQILFNQEYYDASTPAVVDAGYIGVKTEGNWTSTASTQDATMSFYTVLDGTKTAQMTLTSAGLATVTGGVTIATGKHLTVGTVQWDDGSDAIDGERIAADTIDDDSIDFGDVTGADLTLTDCAEITATYITTTKYFWEDHFDDEVSGVQMESGLRADYYVTAGTNYAAAEVTYGGGVGGTGTFLTHGGDDDSVTYTGAPLYNVTQNPIIEMRFKVANIDNVYIALGLVEGSYANKDAHDDDIAVIAVDSDNGHTLGAARIMLITNDNNGGVDYDDTGIDIVAATYVKAKIDLTDTEQPRVWINGSEVAAGSISGTVQAGATMSVYIMVQSLSGAADTLTVDYIRTWQDEG